MGNQDFSEDFRYLEFLKNKKAPALFNDLYDTLRKGTHIQKQSHEELFDFIEIEGNEESISDFIRLFNETQMLNRRGQQHEKYYFIDFIEGSKGNTDRKYIENDELLVGFLIYKVFILDFNYDLSISFFQNAILQNYENYKQGIIKNLGKTAKTTSSTSGDEIIIDTIRKAFNCFDRICWLRLDPDKDGFTFYPAFQRIIDVYSHKINTIDTWLIE